MLKLQFRNHPGSFVKLTSATLTLGRDTSNDVVIEDPSVSDFHAEIISDVNGPVIVDLLSSSGTFVNEHRIKGRCQLKAWDVLRLGTVQLEVTEPNTHRPDDWALRAESDLLAIQFHSLQESTIIGRDAICDITIDSKLLSRQHARIIIQTDTLQVTDLDSSNGTYLNGDRIEQAIARPGDELSFDKHRFTVVGPVSGEALSEETATDQTILREPNDEETVLAYAEPNSPEPTPSPADNSGGDTIMIAGDETLLYVAPPPVAKLTEIGAADSPRLISLELPRQQLGRSEDCELVLADQSVSKVHAEFYFDQGHWHIKDLGSSNGVLVNLEPIEQQALRDRDRIKLGRIEFEFTLPDAMPELDDVATRIYSAAPAQPPVDSDKRAPARASQRRYRWPALAGLTLAGLALLLSAAMLWLNYR